MRLALLVVDVQEAFFKMETCRPSLLQAVEYINGTAELLRQFGCPVFFIQDNEAGGGATTEGFRLFEGLNRKPEDSVIAKDFSNAFWETELEENLRKAGCEFVVISGFAAGGCVNYTYNGALERGFKAALLQHGIAGSKEIYIQTAMETCDVISYDTLEYLLASTKPEIAATAQAVR